MMNVGDGDEATDATDATDGTDGLDAPRNRRPTIYDVAALAGVSKSLVSLVLQGSGQVSASRRAAVESAIETLQYRPSRAASALAGSRTRTIGVLLDDYRNLWFVELLTGLHEQLGHLGYRVALEDSRFHPHADQSPLDGFVSLRVEGIVIATEPSHAMASTLGIPVVVAGSRELRLADADVVANDDRLGGRLATEHLLRLGHQRIGHLSGGGGAARQRAEGYDAAMATASLPARVVRAVGTTEIDGYQTASEVLADEPETTALFAANDTMALGAAAAARDAGLEVPHDLSLIGYDNSPLASSHLLRLTTIDAKSIQVGAEAARALLARIGDPHLPIRTTLVEPELVVRSSTATANR